MDCGFFLPPYKSSNVYFFKDIMAKRKRAIKVSDVAYLYAPQYEDLSCAKILDFAMNFPNIADYLPIEKDWPALPR